MKIIKTLTVIVCSFALLSCSEDNASPLRIGTNIWPGYEPLYLARHKNYLNDKKIQLVEFSSASQVIQAYRNELIDAAALTLDEAILLLQANEDFSVVLVMDISDGADAIVAQKDIASFRDIKGKRIGVENNALGAYVISRALAIENTSKEDVKLIPLDVNEQEKAFINKEVDAVVTFEPVKSILLNAGGRVIFDSTNMPGEIVDIMIVRNSYLNNHVDNVQHLLDAWYQALDYTTKYPNKAAGILGRRMQLNVTDTLATYKGLKLPNQADNIAFLRGKKPKLITTSKRMATLMYEQQLIKKQLNPEILFQNKTVKHR